MSSPSFRFLHAGGFHLESTLRGVVDPPEGAYHEVEDGGDEKRHEEDGDEDLHECDPSFSPHGCPFLSMRFT